MEILDGLEQYDISQLWRQYKKHKEHWADVLEHYRGEDGYAQGESRFTTRNYSYDSERITTYVYLMRCNRNQMIKIGRSHHPEHRERTLQAEEPSIEMIYCMQTDREVEKDLHAAFAEKRVRGEWFKLTTEEIEQAKSLMMKLDEVYEPQRRSFLRLPAEDQKRVLEAQVKEFLAKNPDYYQAQAV